MARTITEVSGAAELTSALSETTRKERRFVLVTSLLLFVVVQGGLRPTGIQALGISLEPGNFALLLKLLFGVHAFVLVAFVIGALAEERCWKERFVSAGYALSHQAEACGSIISSGFIGRDVAVELGDAIRAFRVAAEAHLRPQTLASLQSTLWEAEISLRHDKARKSEAPDLGVILVSEIRRYDMSGIPKLSPAHLGIARAIAQSELYSHYSSVRDERTLRALIARTRLGKLALSIDFRLRYTALPAPRLRGTFQIIQRLNRRAHLRVANGRPLDAMSDWIDCVADQIETLDASEQSVAEMHTLWALAGPLQGVTTSLVALQNSVDGALYDLKRSLGRFSLHIFWEVRVPILIAVSAMVMTLVHAKIENII